MEGIERDVAGGVVAFTAALALLAVVGPSFRQGEIVTAERPCMVRAVWIDPAGTPRQLYRGTVERGEQLERLPGPAVGGSFPARSLADPRVRGYAPELCLKGRR